MLETNVTIKIKIIVFKIDFKDLQQLSNIVNIFSSNNDILVMALRPFHVAFAVADLNKTLHFYRDILGCGIGRTSEKWIDFNFFGHQISAHLKPSEVSTADKNSVDGKNVPVRHMGVILTMEDWHQLADKVRDNNIEFIIEPYIRFEGEPGEQATMFFLDPSGNALEFKAFKDDASIFAT